MLKHYNNDMKVDKTCLHYDYAKVNKTCYCITITQKNDDIKADKTCLHYNCIKANKLVIALQLHESR